MGGHFLKDNRLSSLLQFLESFFFYTNRTAARQGLRSACEVVGSTVAGPRRDGRRTPPLHCDKMAPCRCCCCCCYYNARHIKVNKCAFRICSVWHAYYRRVCRTNIRIAAFDVSRRHGHVLHHRATDVRDGAVRSTARRCGTWLPQKHGPEVWQMVASCHTSVRMTDATTGTLSTCEVTTSTFFFLCHGARCS